MLVNNSACCLLEMMDGVQTAVVSTCISCKTGTWRHVVCACVGVCVWVCLHYALFGTFSQRGVRYPCLLESDPRLCLIGVFTLSGLTRTDTLDLGSPPFAMKRENSDTETCLLLCREMKLCSSSFLLCFSLTLLSDFKSLLVFPPRRWTFQP